MAPSCEAEISHLATDAIAIGLRGSVAIRAAGLHQHGLEHELDAHKTQLKLEEYRSLLERTGRRIAAILPADDPPYQGDPWDGTPFERSSDGGFTFEPRLGLQVLALRAKELDREALKLHELLVQYNRGGCLGALDTTELADQLAELHLVQAPLAFTNWVRAALQLHERARAAGLADVVVPRAQDWRLWSQDPGTLPRRIRFPGNTGVDFVFVPADARGLAGGFLAETELTVQSWRRHGGRPLGDASPLEPATGMSWVEAQRWCEGIGLRLPSEKEWAAAATRPAWSNSFNREGCAHVSGLSGPYEAGRGTAGLPSDQSWCGVLDLAGNVSEWVADPATAAAAGSPPERLLCGGNWQDEASHRGPELRRHAAQSQVGNPLIGLRPALDL